MEAVRPAAWEPNPKVDVNSPEEPKWRFLNKGDVTTAWSSPQLHGHLVTVPSCGWSPASASTERAERGGRRRRAATPRQEVEHGCRGLVSWPPALKPAAEGLRGVTAVPWRGWPRSTGNPRSGSPGSLTPGQGASGGHVLRVDRAAVQPGACHGVCEQMAYLCWPPFPLGNQRSLGLL